MPRCKYCSELYKPARTMQPGRVCNSIECQAKHAEEVIADRRKKTANAERIAAAEDRKTVKIKLEQIKPLSYFAAKAQAAVNAYRRALFEDEPCISCGRHHQGQYHAGHFISRGASPALRFEHLNIWKQCQPCNVAKSGNLIEYRKALVARIGIEKVEWLEGPHELPHWRKEDYLRIESEHKQLLKELRK